MKRASLFFAVLAMTLLCVSSCSGIFNDEPNSGEAVYSYGVSKASGDAITMVKILNAYDATIKSISGATVAGGTIRITGKFKDSDKRVKDACKAAEAEASKVQVASGDCFVFVVRGSYIGTSVSDKEIYSKEYK